MSKIVVEGEVEIDRAVEDVFDYFSDHTNEPEWNPETTHMVKTTAGAVGIGTRYDARS